MSFPTVRGTVMATEEETKRRHMARRRGFFSGLASAMTLRRDEPEAGEGRRRERREGVGGGREAKRRAKTCRGIKERWTGRGRRRTSRGDLCNQIIPRIDMHDVQDICTLYHVTLFSPPHHVHHLLLHPPNQHTLPLPHTTRPHRQRPRTVHRAHSIRHHNIRKYTVPNNHQFLVLDRNSQRREIRPYRFDARIRRFERAVSQDRNREMIRDRLRLRNRLRIFFLCSLRLTIPEPGLHPVSCQPNCSR